MNISDSSKFVFEESFHIQLWVVFKITPTRKSKTVLDWKEIVCTKLADISMDCEVIAYISAEPQPKWLVGSCNILNIMVIVTILYISWNK